jgi:hypothetical protein
VAGAGGNLQNTTGTGGTGGAGGSGGKGGAGGGGGTVTVTAGFGESITVAVNTDVHGGDGSNGIQGGTGGLAVTATGTGGIGGLGGNGGLGGKGGIITMKVQTGQSINVPGNVDAHGGAGGSGGQGGTGGNDTSFKGGRGGNGGSAGNGGNGGNVTLTPPTGVVPATPTVNVGGGAAGPVPIPPGTPNFGSGGTGSSALNNGANGTSGKKGTSGIAGHKNVAYDDDSLDDSTGESTDDSTSAPRKRKHQPRTRVARTTADHTFVPVAYVQPILKMFDREIQAANVLLAPTQDNVTANAGAARVAVNKGSAAFMINTGRDLCVLALHDQSSGDVIASIGGHEFKLKAGEALILSNATTEELISDFPLAGIAVRDCNVQNLTPGLNACICEFSVPSAINQLQTLRSLRSSGDRHDRSLYAKIFKDAAALQMLTAYRGAYRQIK